MFIQNSVVHVSNYPPGICTPESQRIEQRKPKLIKNQRTHLDKHPYIELQTAMQLINSRSKNAG